VHVHIFVRWIKCELASFDFGLYFRQGKHNLLAFVVCENRDVRKHLRMGDGGLDILLEKSVIEGYRLRKGLNTPISFAGESATPRLNSHGLPPVASRVVRKILAARD
jgi:hypothetical protein